MDQIDTLSVAKTLNWIGRALYWLAGLFFIFGALSLNSVTPLVRLIGPLVALGLVGCLIRGLAAIIFNQVKSNELLQSILDKES